MPSSPQTSSHHHTLVNNTISIKQNQCNVVKDIKRDCCHLSCAPVAAIFTDPGIKFVVQTSRVLGTSPFSGDVIHRIQSIDHPPKA